MKQRDEMQPDLIVRFIMDGPAPICFTIPAATLQFERGQKKLQIQQKMTMRGKKAGCFEFFPYRSQQRVEVFYPSLPLPSLQLEVSGGSQHLWESLTLCSRGPEERFPSCFGPGVVWM